MGAAGAPGCSASPAWVWERRGCGSFFSLIKKLELLLPASDTMGRPSTRRQNTEEGTAASPQLYQLTVPLSQARCRPPRLLWSNSMNPHSSPGRWALVCSCDRFGTRIERSGSWAEF